MLNLNDTLCQACSLSHPQCARSSGYLAPKLAAVEHLDWFIWLYSNDPS